MKKTIALFAAVMALSAFSYAQKTTQTFVRIPEKSIEFSAERFQLTEDGCELSGEVTVGVPDEKLPIVDEHNVPGILTNMNHIGGTWVLQCTAGPGYCFTYYTK